MKVGNIWKIGIAGGTLFFCGILFHICFPSILDQEVKAKISLEKGKLRRFIWDKPPFFLTGKFYVFNVTNPDGVMNGATPIVQEVGPFVYDLVFENTNQFDNDTDDTVSFTQRHTYFFNDEKSAGLTGDEIVIVPNIFVLTSANFVMRTMPNAMPILSKAVDSIFDQPESLFIRAKVRDVLFDGLPLICNATDFASTTVCREVKTRYQDFNMKKVDENTFLVSLWGSQNGTDTRDRMRISRGIRNIRDVGKVVEFNNKPNLTVWGDPRCDKIEGSDGSIFHPFFNEDGRDPLDLFIPSMCRTFHYQFKSKTQFLGVDGLRYTTDIGVDGQHNDLEKCYCMDPRNCFRKGLFDLYKCAKLPLILTNPHFYQADPYYTSSIGGLTPDEEKHTTYVDIDPLTGTPMVFSIKIQFNLMLLNSEKMRLMSNVPNKLLPLFWMDEEFAAPEFMMADLISAHHAISLATSVKFLLILGGLGMSAYAVYLYYKANFGSSDLVSKKMVQAANSNLASGAEKRLPMNTLQPPHGLSRIN